MSTRLIATRSQRDGESAKRSGDRLRMNEEADKTIDLTAITRVAQSIALKFDVEQVTAADRSRTDGTLGLPLSRLSMMGSDVKTR